MPALDTNLLVRCIVQDDAAQLAAATRPTGRSVADGATMFVPVTVVLELEWVLRSNFEFGKDDMPMSLSSLVSSAELTFESERALEVALQLFRKTSADFYDCLHVALSTRAGEQPLWTSTRVPPRSAAIDCWARYESASNGKRMGAHQRVLGLTRVHGLHRRATGGRAAAWD